MSKKFDTVVYIGRFQPFHNGHAITFRKAIELADHVLILVGSANVAPNIRNPWSFLQRKDMITAALKEPHVISLANGVSVDIQPLNDIPYNDNAWVEQVQKTITTWARGKRVAIIGMKSDHTSYYLDLFPQWETVVVDEVAEFHATDIRNQLFRSGLNYTPQIPKAVLNYISQWWHKESLECSRLEEEYRYIQDYKKGWANSPHPPTFVTVDAVVIQSGHVLMVQRRAAPGEGLWALPGGFVGQTEAIENAMIRELREETRLKVPVPVLKGSIKESKVFDATERSLRGRTITHAFYLELAPGDLSPVKGSDDAKDARWVPFNEFMRMEKDTFEDHHAIVRHFIKM